LLFALLVGAGAGASAKYLESGYSAGARLQVSVQQTAGVPNETLLAANELAAQYAQLASSNSVLERAARSLDISPGSLSGNVTGTPVSQLNLIDISVTADSPGEAARRANAVATALARQIRVTNASQAKAFIARATKPLAATNSEIARVQAQVDEAAASLSTAKTANERSRNALVLSGSQSLLAQLLTQRNTTMAQLAADAALGQPTITQVTHASGGSRTQPSPEVFAGAGFLAGAIVAGQLFVLGSSRRRTPRG
jgi:hypothetical protein